MTRKPLCAWVFLTRSDDPVRPKTIANFFALGFLFDDQVDYRAPDGADRFVRVVHEMSPQWCDRFAVDYGHFHAANAYETHLSARGEIGKPPARRTCSVAPSVDPDTVNQPREPCELQHG